MLDENKIARQQSETYNFDILYGYVKIKLKQISIKIFVLYTFSQ